MLTIFSEIFLPGIPTIRTKAGPTEDSEVHSPHSVV